MNNFFPDKNILIILLSGHLIGDFIFQSDRVFRFKCKGLRGILWHSLLVFAATAASAAPFCGNALCVLAAAAMIFVFHFLIDTAKYRSRAEESVSFILDQLVHLISVFITAVALKSLFPAGIRNIHLMKYVLLSAGIILVMYFLKYFMKSLYKILDIKDEPSRSYNVMESAERLVIFAFSYMHGFFFLLIAFAVIPRSLYAINTNKQHIFYDVIISMLFASASGIMLRKATLSEPFTLIQFVVFSISFLAVSILLDRLLDIITGLFDR